MKKVLLVLIAVLAMFTSFAQSTANYDFSTVTTGSLVEDANSNAIDMTSGATNVYGAGVDTYTASFQNLPFPFIFMGQLYTQFSVKPDGAIRLGSTLISGHSTTVAANTAFLSPMGADNATAPSVGSVEYKTVGSAPNRTLVVQWTNIRMNWNASSNTNYGTFQARLYEGTGVIEYVYGQMWNNGASALAVSAFISSSNTVGTVGAVETIATTPTYNATVTSATTTSMVANAAMANLNSAADGSRRVFTFTPPPAPAAPTALNFTGIGVTRMTLNWTDNSADEVGFGILRSTDDVTYTLVGSTGENATSFEATGLDEGTTYFWQVVAFNEGTFSSAAIGSEATVAAVPLTGTYTIDNTQPTSGNNFNSFAAAINALSDNGLGGAVIFDVTAGQTFIENLPAFTVTGTASNTITFQKSGVGANPIIQSTGTSATTDAILLLNGVSYYTFDGIDLIQTGTAAADWVEYGIYVRNSSATVGSQNNTFKNMSITLDRSNTNSRGIYQNVAVAPTNATGANSDNKYYNLTIKNAFGGIYLLGNATYPDLNTEIGTTSAGIYNIIGDGSVTNDIGLSSSTTQTYGIRTSNQSDAKIFNNIVSNVGNSGTVDGILVELFKGNSLVYNNKISGIANISTSSTSAASGIRLTHTTTGTHNIKVYNNFVSDITRGFTGTATVSRYIKGIYISGTGGNTSQSYDIDFNSVRLDGSGSPNTSSACFEIATTSGPIFRVRNNIFANFTSAQGATAKHFGYYSTAAATIGSAGSVLQYNDIYIPNDEGVSGHAGRGNTANYNTVANLEAGFTTPSGGAANNISANPIFASSTDLHAGSPALDGAADPANNTPWVITDIDDDPRNDPADIGADEFDVLALDMGAAALVGLDAATGCYTNAETVTVTITNFAGTDIDFSVNPVTVTTNVTGAATANLSAIVNAGTLASGASMNVDMSTTLDMSVAGTYTFNASTSVVGDGNASNDAMTTDSRIRIALAAGTAKASPDSYCVTGGTPTLSLTGHEGYSGIQWQESTTSMSGYTDIGGATTSPYTIGSAITQTMYYQAVLTCGAETATSTEDTVVLNNPEITSTTPASRCGVGTVDLAATTNASAINWYENPTGGTAIHTGTTFTTPVISENTTYYVAASSGSSTINVAPSAPEGSATATSLNTYPSIFTLTESITLNSIQVFSTTGTAITISLYNAAGTTQLLTTGSNPVVAASSPIINLGWNIEPGTYRIVATMTGNFYRDGITTPSIVYPIQLGTSGYISGYASSLTGTLTTGAAYYFLYNWSISTGCESARTPVTATINTPPAITASAVDEVICNGASTDLSVSSAHSEYTYTWTPGNHVGATYNVSPSSTTKYYVNAIDNSGGSFDGCANIDSVTVTVQPTITDIIATVESFCVIGGSSELSLVPSTGYAANSIQWQSSSDNSNFSDIGGANDATYTTPTISATTYYRALIKNGVGTVCNQYDKTIEVTNPEITSTTPASRCGTGTVDLSATSNSSTINWYENPSGGTPIHTGGTFTTPVLSNTTTYYAAGQSSASGTYVVGDGANTSSTYSNPFYSLWSNTHVQHLITVAEMNAAGLVGGPITALGINITNVGTLPMIDLDIKIGHTSAVSMATFSADPVSSVFTSSSYMPTLGLNMMTFTTPFVWDGVSNIVIDICHGNGSSSATMSRTASVDNTSYVSTIKTHTSAATSAATQCGNTSSNILTYSVRPQFTFDGVGGCVGDRTPVTATINTPPAITASAVDATICVGSSTDLSVSSAHSEYTYTWTPGNHVGATYNVSPSSTTKYYVNAIDNSGGSFDGCANIDSVTVTVAQPTPVIITASRPGICESGDASKMYTNFDNVTVFSEDFETGAIGWATTNTSTGGANGPAAAAWTIYPSPTTLSSQSISSNDASHFYHTNSDAQGSGATSTNTTLTSPAFSTVGFGTLNLEFYHYYRYITGPGAYVKISTDGNTWNTVYTTPNVTVGGPSAFVKETVNLDAYINEPTVYIQFAYITAGWYWGWAIDNVLVKGNAAVSSTWTPTTGLFTDAAATTPYAGGLIDTVYALPTATVTYTASATNISSCVSTENQEIAVYPANAWNGSESTVWTEPANWCGGVPTSSTSIVIPSSAVRMPAITSGVQEGASINFSEATTLSIASGASLNVTNVIANGATELSGSGSLNVSGSFAFGNVNNKTFTSNGVLVLKSTASATARIADVTNGGTNSGNSIVGDVIQERFIPAKAARKWILLSSPVTQSVANSWQQQIHITGAGTGGTVCPTLSANSNGFDATTTNAPSIYTYNASNAQGSRWTALSNTTANVGAGVGFRVNVRGDRSLGCSLLDGTSMVPSAVTLRATGTLSDLQKNMGSFTIEYPNNGIGNYVFIGNPYPSAISFSDLLAANSLSLNSTYAIYIPANPAGNYTYWSDDDGAFTGGIGYDDATGNIIANGQAIFVESNVAGNLTLNFNEGLKTTETNTGYFRNARVYNEKIKVNYLQNNTKVDEVVIRYAADAGISNTEVGKKDIVSMNSGTYITSLKANKGMVVQTRDLKTLTNDEVWLNVGATASGTYQLNFSDFDNFAATDIYLIDHYTNTTQNIRQNDTYEFSIDKDNAATKGSARFSVVFNRTIQPEYVNNMIKMYPNPANKQVTLQLPQTADNNIVYSIKVTDLAGKIVMQQKANGGTHQLTIDRLTTGTYFVEIIDNKGNRTTEKLIKN